ncbi:MAG: hypothetical protein NUV60_02825 [Patescibacteria group bacterium]|nr:hypothetical protein [Patescibacteria group bacterium]
MDFEKVLQQMRDLQATLRKKKEALAKIERKIEDKVCILNAACRSICLGAIRLYNTKAPLLLIDLDSDRNISTSIDIECNKVDLSVNLKYQSGREPDEDLYDEDADKIEAELGTIINEKLKAEDIPLTFGKLGIPVHYFGK